MLEQLRARLVRQGPSLLRIPLKFTPFALQRQLLQQVLSWQFRQALADGDLEFLESRWLKIEVRDLALQWFMTVENDKLVVSQHAEADVSFSGDANDLILIAARKQDPDTLFFQRRLQIEGIPGGPVCEKFDGRHRAGKHACAAAHGAVAVG